jgi:small subunit ribosomal protein S18
MARDRDRDRDRRRAPKDATRRTKKKVCIFCKEHIEWVDYKDVNLLRRFMSDRGKIRARRVSGNCAQHQRDVAIAIKTARELALLPYTQRSVSERGPGRGRPPREDRGGPPAGLPEADGEVVGDLEEEDVEIAVDEADLVPEEQP